MSTKNTTIAYFTMEIAFDPNLPTYSGGLGILAGDTVRSAADLNLPFVVVTLLHRKGYFRQELSNEGDQIDKPDNWEVEKHLEEMPGKVYVELEGRKVAIRVWKYNVQGFDGFKVPVFLLDTDIEENSEYDRSLTDFLYGGDDYYRLCQEVILGIGGVRILRNIGYDNVEKFHMNEGHSALLIFELIKEKQKTTGKESLSYEDIEDIKNKCVFTTHTPVPAGHDQFPVEMVDKVLRDENISCIGDFFCFHKRVNLTYLALNLSNYVNGVAMRHGEVSKLLFAPYEIEAITNGVHVRTWACEEMQGLFNKYISAWKKDNFSLRYVSTIPKVEIWNAHIQAKSKLIKVLNESYGANFNPEIFTLGFARRSTKYKRADLIFHDIERLKKISDSVGKFQIVYGGKAHPQDFKGREIIKAIFYYKNLLKDKIEIVYVPNYDMDLAKYIVSGVDLWLNNPESPLEASGTSGMKAAVNGVPSLSILDGWWIEGHIEGVTGWAISNDRGPTIEEVEIAKNDVTDSNSLYEKLEKIILLYYSDRENYIRIMRNSISVNGSFFNTQRMLIQYLINAYKIHT